MPHKVTAHRLLVVRAQRPEHLTIYDQDDIPVARVSETVARALIEAQLVTPIGKNRIIALRFCPGVTNSVITAFIHCAMSHKLPIAEDNFTVMRDRSSWIHIRIQAWAPHATS